MKLLRFSVFPFAIALASFADSGPALAQTAPAPNSTVVYVSDFDLDVVVYRAPPGRPAPRNSPPPAPANTTNSSENSPKPFSTSPPSSPSRPKSTADPSTEETPADRANALLNAVSESLVRALNQAGYHAERLPSGAPLPKAGLRIRGVFAEADEKNRARRLLIGGVPVSPNMILFVGVNNLTRPEHPLYELADPPIPDSRHGPVITVTSYAPAARFELSRDPDDEELKKVSTRIAASLTALLNANPLVSLQ